MRFKKTSSLPKLSRALCGVLISVAASLLSACAGIKSAPPEETVKERATERWQALLKRDTRKAYEYMAPSYRSVVSAETFGSKFGTSVVWVSAEVVSVACETAKCTATVRIEAKPLMGAKFGNTIETHVDETWLLEDGRWWFFQKL